MVSAESWGDRYSVVVFPHVASEAIVDRVPQLRAVCRGITQMDTASIIKDYVSEAVREAIYPEKSKKNLEEA